jgi:hypothetical protein
MCWEWTAHCHKDGGFETRILAVGRNIDTPMYMIRSNVFGTFLMLDLKAMIDLLLHSLS